MGSSQRREVALLCLLFFFNMHLTWSHQSNTLRESTRRKLKTGTGGAGGKKMKARGTKKYSVPVPETISIDDGDNISTPVTIETEAEFLIYCQEHLLGASVVEDGLISQDEVATFITSICDVLFDERLPAFSCPTPEFSDLAGEVQLTFVWFICPTQDDRTLIDCLTGLGSSGELFGYSTSFPEQLESDVSGFCCGLLPFMQMSGLDPLTTNICPVPPDIPEMPETMSPSVSFAPSTFPSFAPSPSPTLPQIENTPPPINPPPPPPTRSPVAPTAPPTDSPVVITPLNEDDGGSTLSVGVIAGIALGGAACCILMGFVATRRAKEEND